MQNEISKLQLEAKKQLAEKATLVSKHQIEAKKQLAQKADLIGKQQLESKKQLSKKTHLAHGLPEADKRKGLKLNIKFSENAKSEELPGGCWVTFYESSDYRDKSITLHGPARYSKLDNLPGGNGEDWGDQFDSLRTGPNAWVRIFNDENYEDDNYTFGPGSSIRELPSGDDVDSLIIYDHNPEG